MVEMAIIGAVISVQREMNRTDSGSFFFEIWRWGELIIYMEGCLVPDPSVSSLYVASSFPIILFS